MIDRAAHAEYATVQQEREWQDNKAERDATKHLFANYWRCEGRCVMTHDLVTVKIVASDSDELRTLLASGWRVVEVQSDSTVVLLQPRDPDDESVQ
jgi:hypothetical protein